MRRTYLREAKEALAKALKGLEEAPMVLHDDPKLIAVKEEIRRTMEKLQLEITDEEDAA